MAFQVYTETKKTRNKQKVYPKFVTFNFNFITVIVVGAADESIK